MQIEVSSWGAGSLIWKLLPEADDNFSPEFRVQQLSGAGLRPGRFTAPLTRWGMLRRRDVMDRPEDCVPIGPLGRSTRTSDLPPTVAILRSPNGTFSVPWHNYAKRELLMRSKCHISTFNNTQYVNKLISALKFINYINTFNLIAYINRFEFYHANTPYVTWLSYGPRIY